VVWPQHPFPVVHRLSPLPPCFSIHNPPFIKRIFLAGRNMASCSPFSAAPPLLFFLTYKNVTPQPLRPPFWVPSEAVRISCLIAGAPPLGLFCPQWFCLEQPVRDREGERALLMFFWFSFPFDGVFGCCGNYFFLTPPPPHFQALGDFPSGTLFSFLFFSCRERFLLDLF